ncbi:MAG: YfhO family protein, partial [Lachnospiraceae bacterium]|nr:YfhO family protein [Lachnospiraceae bacterium]
GYLSDPGPGFNNLFHSMAGGLGGNIYGTVILCLSPPDLIFSFVSLRSIPTVLYFMILFKIGLCGVSACFYLSHHDRTVLSAPVAVLFSCCYALMSYNIMYYVAPMWYDCVILLPLLALSLEKIIAGKKSPAFIVLTALCLIDDYYIAYMVVIALIIYFVFRSAEEGTGIREFIVRSLRFAFHGLIASGIAMFVILPAWLDLQRGKMAESGNMPGALAIKNSLPDVLRSFIPGSYAGFEFNASPNIFCGTVVTVMALIWLIYGKKNIRARLAGVLVIAVYFASFIVGPIDRMWHGFRDPISFSVRYAFTFSFFMIVFAARGYRIAVGVLKNIPGMIKQTVLVAVFVFSLFELIYNSHSVLAGLAREAGHTAYEDYLKTVDVYDHLLSVNDLRNDGTYGRIANSTQFSGFDGSLFGYSGFSRFSSSYNYYVSELLGNLGFASANHVIVVKGMTPASIGLFDTGYVISLSDEASDIYDPVYEYNGYELLKNTCSLPFAYAINDSIDPLIFGSDPYINQNIVYDEFFGSGEGTCDGIYTEVPLDFTGEEENLPEGVDSSEKYVFSSVNSGHYFLYVNHMNEVVYLNEFRDEKGNLKPLNIIRDYVLDGKQGKYGNGQYSYCVDLGYLEEGSEHELILMSSNDVIGASKVYYYNEDLFRTIISGSEGFEIKKINSKGITLGGSLSEDSDVLITLPYEAGYRVYVDGVRTDYGSYRNTLMVIRAVKGEHEIVIKYVPPGLLPGILVSVLSIVCFVLYAYIPLKRKNK